MKANPLRQSESRAGAVLASTDVAPGRRCARSSGRRRVAVIIPLLLVTAVGLLIPQIALAQEQELLAGRTIVAAEVEGLKQLVEESVLYYLGIEVGQSWDPREVNGKVLDLWRRSLIDDVRLRAVAEGDGVKVIVTIVERPLLLSLDYEGLDKVKRNDIGDAVDKERVEIYEGLPVNLGELVRLEGVVKALYEERGYRFASVDVQIEPVSASEVRVTVVVDEGNKVKIGRVDFDGNELFEPGRLRRQMEKTKKSNLLTRIRKRDVYNPATVDEDLEKVRDLYRRYGYKDVVVGEPETEIMQRGGGGDDPNRRRRLPAGGSDRRGTALEAR